MHLIKLSILSLLALSAISYAGGNKANIEETASTQTPQGQPSAAQLKLGKRSYIRCQACHTLGKDEAHLTGPNLHGLFSASAGQKPGFTYSQALIESKVEWNRQTLKAWLKSPFAFIPGNKMAFAGISNERELDALLAYLESQTK